MSNQGIDPPGERLVQTSRPTSSSLVVSVNLRHVLHIDISCGTGGTAGLTVAARLVDAGFSVLVLEAGGFPDQYGLPWKSPALTGEMTSTSVPSALKPLLDHRC